MAYTVNKSDGSVFATIADGTIDNTGDLTLIGKNFAGYGEFMAENLVFLVENFAKATAPATPIAGQIWWDTAKAVMSVYTGTAWKTISSSTAQGTPPTGAVIGDLWWDSTNGQLNIWDGAAWVLIGPAFTSGTGQSGAIVDTVTDTLSASHVIVRFLVNNVVVSILSKDATFTPQVAIDGFATISPGFNLNSTISNNAYNGLSGDAVTLGGFTASQYLRSDVNDNTTGILSVLNDGGFVVGADGDLKISVSGSDVSILNDTTDGNILIITSPSGTPQTTMTIDGTANRVLVNADPLVDLGVATKQYVDSSTGASGALLANGSVLLAGNLLPDADNTRNLGALASKYNTIYATTFNGEATSTLYADIAERFEADAIYTPGTVVALGGPDEITKVVDDLSEDVFGVISTKPAHLMNSAAGDDNTHPPVALSGRVPVLVVGAVNKGDRLVSAGNGIARAAAPGEASAFNVIGRAITSNQSGRGTVEAYVTVN